MQDSTRLRRIEIVVFCAYIAFVVAGLYLFGMVDDSQFIALMNAHFGLAAAWYVIAGGSVIALGAIVVGGLPIGVAVLRYALGKERRNLLLLVVPLIAFGVLLVTAIVLFQVYGPLPPSGSGGNLGQVWAVVLPLYGVLFVIAAVASTAAVCVAVARSEVSEQTFRLPGITIIVQPYAFAIWPAAVATLAMLVMLVGTVVWGWIASTEAPQVFVGDGTFVSWMGIVVAMAIATVVAGVAVFQGVAERWPRSQGSRP